MNLTPVSGYVVQPSSAVDSIVSISITEEDRKGQRSRERKTETVIISIITLFRLKPVIISIDILRGTSPNPIVIKIGQIVPNDI